jgi:hypothetical protein
MSTGAVPLVACCNAGRAVSRTVDLAADRLAFFAETLT